MKKFYEPGISFSWHRLLRRTLVLLNMIRHSEERSEDLWAVRRGYLLKYYRFTCTDCHAMMPIHKAIHHGSQ